MKDLRIELRFKNAVLLAAIEEQFGHLHVTSQYNNNPGILYKVSKLTGVRYEYLTGYVNLSLDPRRQRQDCNFGTFKASAKLVADALGRKPEDIFPESIYAERFRRKMIADVESEKFLSLSDKEVLSLPASKPLDQGVLEAQREAINNALVTLKPRDAKIVKMLFGLDGYGVSTTEEVARKLNMTTSRVWQIQKKALRMLRHPSRSAPLRRTLEKLEDPDSLFDGFLV